ncbi:MAG: hypothetical protein HETSPECPRED_003545 [Heterodermia speciosa]|uniref:Uncharacterized protein n=1 Tax=Heterodermia speciosa TaxID=116794 RepID=A0A8H3F7U9_9LECA|nr:MAG: hypothetical protein HETSPECPRED_003545 [Heterodermia speciosa]
MEPHRFVAPVAIMVAPSAPSTHRPASSQPCHYHPNDPKQYLINHHLDVDPTAILKRQLATQTRSYHTPPPKRLRLMLPSATPGTDPSSSEHSSANGNPEDERRGRSLHRFASPFKIIRCDENPAFFSGRLDPVATIQDQQQGITPPTIHSRDLRVCQNRVKHPDAPYYICAMCHNLARRHFQLTAPILLRPKFVPLCEACGEQHLKKNFEKNGRQRYVFGCSCLDSFHEEWRIMCFDCWEAALMSLNESYRWEMESRVVYLPGPSQDAAIGYKQGSCRCSIYCQPLSEVSICPGCEGIQDGRRPAASNSIGVSHMNRLSGKGTTMREEHSDVPHDLRIGKVPEPQYQNMKAGIGLLGGEKSGIGMEAGEQHLQLRNAEVGRQGLKEIAMGAACNGLDSKQGAFNNAKPQVKADDVGVRREGSEEVAEGTRDSDPEYEPGVIEDDDSSSSTSTSSLVEDS